MGQGDCVSHASQISKLSGSTPGSAPPTHLSPSLSSFSSMGCKGLRVPVLITEERCRAWTPGLTARRDSLWDHFSPDGIAWQALSPQSLVHVCVKLCCVSLGLCAWRCKSHLPASLKIFTTAWIEPNPLRSTLDRYQCFAVALRILSRHIQSSNVKLSISDVYSRLCSTMYHTSREKVVGEGLEEVHTQVFHWS